LGFFALGFVFASFVGFVGISAATPHTSL
jgi:hypothetical protein